MPTFKLSFNPIAPDLSATAKSYLEQRFMQEDYKSYWISIESLLEEIADPDGTIFTGLTLPKKFNWDRLTVNDIPKQWWVLMKFSPKVEKAMKAFWKKHSTGEVEWKW